MSNAVIKIDKEKCTGCKQCIKDCPATAIKLVNGKAEAKPGCIECGHCYAICPSNAVEMVGYSTEGLGDMASMESFDSKELLQAMKSRRTVRRFKDMPVEKEKLDMILEAGRFSPTGANSQNVAYTILGSKQTEIEKECVKLFRTGVKAGSIFVPFLKDKEIDDNFFFKKAPVVIVVSGKDSVNASLASSYMELMAESLGLGVLYSGFFVMCSSINPKIKSTLKLPKGHKVATCMVIGYPDVKYQRIAPRRALKAKTL